MPFKIVQFVCLCLSIYQVRCVYNPNFSMLEGLHAFFNSSKNPHLTSPLLLISNSTMFSPSYNSSSGSKLPLEGAWSPPPFIFRGCSSPNSNVQGLPLLVANRISSFSPIGMYDPTIPGLIILGKCQLCQN